MKTLEALRKEATDLVEAIKSGNAPEDYGQKMTDLRAQIEQAKAELDAVKSGEDLIAALNAAPPLTVDTLDDAPARTIGEHFVKACKDGLNREAFRGQREKAQVSAPEYGQKAAGDPITTTGLTSEQLDQAVEGFGRETPTIAALFSTGSLTGSTLVYREETAKEGNFATVAEGGRKPKLTYHYVERREGLKKIAGLTDISDEMIEDYAYLVSEINANLLADLALAEEQQLLAGDGTGSNVLGILNRSGVIAVASASAADDFDAIERAATQIQIASRRIPDAIVMHPTTADKLRLKKDLNGQYYLGGPAYAPYGNGLISGRTMPPIWGLPVHVTTAIGVDKVLVGAFKSATFFRKGGVKVAISYENKDNFETNLATLRAEERVGLKVPKGSAFAVVTLAAA